MKIRVPLGIITAVMMILAVMILPVSAVAQDVTTTASVASGGGSAPIVLAKWETDTSTSGEDGDTGHATPGSQFLPPIVYGGKKTINYYSVIYDEEENGNVNIVAWDVYYPEECWGNGSFIYQVMGTQLSQAEGESFFQEAMENGLLKVGNYEDANTIFTEYIQKGTAAVWYGQADLYPCSPAGSYVVEANAVDHNNNWAEPLYNTFTYVPVAAFEIDFNTVDYGTLNLKVPKWVAGNTIFKVNDGRPTVRNIGNTFIQMTVAQDDMQFGNSLDGWNVEWGARMGNDINNAVYYGPYEEPVTLPNYLEICEWDELDFYINALKGTPGEKTGTMTLGAVSFCPTDSV